VSVTASIGGASVGGASITVDEDSSEDELLSSRLMSKEEFIARKHATYDEDSVLRE